MTRPTGTTNAHIKKTVAMKAEEDRAPLKFRTTKVREFTWLDLDRSRKRANDWAGANSAGDQTCDQTGINSTNSGNDQTGTSRADNAEAGKPHTSTFARERMYFASAYQNLIAPCKEPREQSAHRSRVLVLDTETQLDPRQRVRIVQYAIFDPIDDEEASRCGPDAVGVPGNYYRRVMCRIAYNPAIVTAEELNNYPLFRSRECCDQEAR